jgi:glycosyltransferase involved in cell wall biosynthesis
MNQTLNDLEIVVVNDGSIDESAKIIERLSKEDKRIVFIDLKKNQGVHEARLAGLKKASGKWIGFLDSDDFARPKMYEMMYETATKYDADIVICGSCRVDSRRKPIAPKIRFSRNEKVITESFRKFCSFQFGTGTLWNKLYRREIILPYTDMHFPWRQDINEDLLLNIGCFQKTKTVYLMKDVFHEYVFKQGSITYTIQREKAYVDTYRAFAIAVNLFAGFDDNVLENLVDMYRKQLSWECYRIGDLKKLVPYKHELKEATDLIYQKNPLALGLLVSRFESPELSVKKITTQIAHKCISLFRSC